MVAVRVESVVENYLDRELDLRSSSHCGAARDAEVLRYLRCEGSAAERAALRSAAITANLGLVHMVVRSFGQVRVDFTDLTQVGAIGLILALDRFDPDRGVTFASFAVPHISGQIRHYLRDEVPVIHVPRRTRELAAELRQLRERLVGELLREPSNVELARASGLTLSELLDVVRSERAQRIDLLDWVDEDDGGSVDPALEHVDERETLKALLATLPPRARAVVELHFLHGKSNAQIAADLGIAPVSVSRTLATALAKLRRAAA